MDNRTELLKEYLKRNFSSDTIIKTGEHIGNMTERMKEETAKQMLVILKECKTEDEFISRMWF